MSMIPCCRITDHMCYIIGVLYHRQSGGCAKEALSNKTHIQACPVS